MEGSSLLSLPEGLCILQIHEEATALTISVTSTRPCSYCPLCAQASSSVHSHYSRTVRDVPCGGHHVRLHLAVRKFFSERPEPLVRVSLQDRRPRACDFSALASQVTGCTDQVKATMRGRKVCGLRKCSLSGHLLCAINIHHGPLLALSIPHAGIVNLVTELNNMLK
jgi:hypothetical protein